jgi:hypothetical protein
MGASQNALKGYQDGEDEQDEQDKDRWIRRIKLIG